MRALVAVDVDKIAGGVIGCVTWHAAAASVPQRHRQLQRVLWCGLRPQLGVPLLDLGWVARLIVARLVDANETRHEL
eukprot:3783872-Prymnesium_polylepis.1